MGLCDEDGCSDGFSLTVGKSKCVTTITDCLKYENDGKCGECGNDKVLDSTKRKCVDKSGSNDS